MGTTPVADAMCPPHAFLRASILNERDKRLCHAIEMDGPKDGERQIHGGLMSEAMRMARDGEQWEEEMDGPTDR